MSIEEGDLLELFSCQLRGFYWHGKDGWAAHYARPGIYRVKSVLRETVILEIDRKLGGVDWFQCSLNHIKAVVLPEYHHHQGACHA